MNTYLRVFGAAVLAAGVLGTSESRAQTRVRHSRQVGGADVGVFAGGRVHMAQPRISGLPYERGDLTGAVGVEFRDSEAYWQVLVDGVETLVGARSDRDRAVTPQINLIFRDRMFVGGFGALVSYLVSEEDDNRWSRLYYQALLGLELPVGRRLNVSAFAAYPYQRWRNLYRFRSAEIEYSFGASFRF